MNKLNRSNEQVNLNKELSRIYDFNKYDLKEDIEKLTAKARRRRHRKYRKQDNQR